MYPNGSQAKINPTTKRGDSHIVRVIDSIMGSGKTTWAIMEMNAHSDQRYLYVTPFLKEIERIIAACPQLNIKQPDDKTSKTDSFRQLLKDGRNIAISHELFSRLRLTPTIYELITAYGYNLILDEVLDVIIPLKESKTDVDCLLKGGLITVDEQGYVHWHGGSDYEGKHKEIRDRAKSKTLIWFENSLFIWTFPKEIIPTFSSVNVLTYLFEGSHMCSYFDLYGIPYGLNHIDNRELRQGIDHLIFKKQELRNLITVYDGKLNNIGDNYYSLSSTWYKNNRHKTAHIPSNNTYNYLRNICNANVNNAMYSIYDRFRQRYKINGYMNSYVPCNARATNEHKDRKYLAYLINVFDNPYVLKWFKQQGIQLDEEQFALSQLLQWVWRSAIRDNDAIMLYLPSRRMRELFSTWLYEN